MIEISFRFLNSPSLILWKIFSPAESAQAEPDYEMLDKFHEYQEKAEIYHLYHSIQRYTVSNIVSFAAVFWDVTQPSERCVTSQTDNGFISGMLACCRLTVVGDERKKKKASAHPLFGSSPASESLEQASGMLPVSHPIEFTPIEFAPWTHYELSISSLPSPSMY